jgi:hypothetical protein
MFPFSCEGQDETSDGDHRPELPRIVCCQKESEPPLLPANILGKTWNTTQPRGEPEAGALLAKFSGDFLADTAAQIDSLRKLDGAWSIEDQRFPTGKCSKKLL